MHSEVMELGGWLNQVSVVYPKQKLALRVGGRQRDCVHLVVSESIGGSNSGEKSGRFTKPTSIWPVLSNTHPSPVDLDNVEAPCILLVQDTEVIVEPNPRQSKKVVSWSAPLRVIPSHLDWSQSILQTVARMTNLSDEYLPLAVEPGCILVNTDAWTFQTHWARIRPKSKAVANHQRIIRVAKSSRVSVDDAGMLKKGFVCMLLSIFNDEKEKSYFYMMILVSFQLILLRKDCTVLKTQFLDLVVLG